MFAHIQNKNTSNALMKTYLKSNQTPIHMFEEKSYNLSRAQNLHNKFGSQTYTGILVVDD